MRLGTLPALLLACLLAPACGDAPSGSAEGPSKDAAAPLRVGVEAKYPPFESLNAQGAFEGFDIDLATELGKSLGRPVTFVDMDWDSLIPSLQSDRIDLICSGMSRTEERAEVVDFSVPYAQAPMKVLVSTKSGRDLGALSDLDDPSVRIAVQRGTTGEKKARAAFGKAEIVQFGTENEAAATVGTGRNHAFVYDALSVDRHHGVYPDTTRILDGSLGTEDYCMAVKKGSALRAQVDAFVTEARKPDGLIDRLVDRWLPGMKEKLQPR